MSQNGEPKIFWKRKVILNQSSFRISIPLEIAEAFKLEQGQTLKMFVEDKKLIIDFSDE